MKRGIALLLLLAASASVAWARPHRKAVPVTTLGTRAEEALFVRSDLEAAQALAAAALARDPANRGALFVAMEASALQADDGGTLAAAVRLCGGSDVEARIAAARIAELAGNRPVFLRHVSSLRKMIAANVPNAHRLAEALVRAAADGAPGIALPAAASEAGLLTEWRISPALGRFGNVAFDRQFAPERDQLSAASYDGKQPEAFAFPDGVVHLPEYFPRDGVLYAAAEFTARTVPLRLELQSTGTVEVFVDGAPVLVHDSRYRALPERSGVALRVGPGQHRVVVKFLATATPFRVALFPRPPAGPEAPPKLSPAALEYAAAADRLWAGDALAALSAAEKHTATAYALLRAEALRQASASDPQIPGTLQQAIDAAPGALAARLRLAQLRLSAGRYEAASEIAHTAVEQRPDSAEAQELAYQLAWHEDDENAAAAALRARLQLHPSCAAWRDAVDFYSHARAFSAAESAMEKLRGCGPGSLAYAGALAATGRHAQADEAALEAAHGNPFDRDALALAAEEAVLAGNAAEAKNAAEQLSKVAPNSARFRRWAQQLEAPEPPMVLDSATDDGFAAGSEFYQPYRRDGLAMVARTRDRRFVGGLAVMVLNDRVAQRNADGTSALYVHELLRVLNRAGVERYGEVALPQGAEVLELRTIQPDGSIAEPEQTANKRTVSMPALEPGSVIEQEYVVRHADSGGIAAHPEDFHYTFGSLAAPVLFGRFVTITPEGVSVAGEGEVPVPAVQAANGTSVRTWERNDILQPAIENALPSGGLLPSVQLLDAESGGWAAVRDRYRDALIAATGIGARTRDFAGRLEGTDREKLQQAYSRLLTQVQRGGGSMGGGDLSSAEDALTSGEGSRTAAMVAIAAAEGWRPELLLARRLDRPRRNAIDGAEYQRPLVRLWIREGAALAQVVLDVETDGLTFGGIPGDLARSDALVVPRTTPGQAAPLFAAITGSVPDESRADARLALDADGNATAKLTITMGPSRAAQMRSILRGIERNDRQHFFDQLALRIFPGAADVSGQVLHENDVLHPVQVEITCRAAHFADLSAATAQISQIAPALGLRRMYAGADERRFPLYLDAALFETATFVVTLPPGVQLVGGAGDTRLDSEFGSYRAEFRETAPGVVEVVRSFHFEPQIIEPARYPSFARLARQIEEIERRRLTLGGAVYSSRAR